MATLPLPDIHPNRCLDRRCLKELVSGCAEPCCTPSSCGLLLFVRRGCPWSSLVVSSLLRLPLALAEELASASVEVFGRVCVRVANSVQAHSFYLCSLAYQYALSSLFSLFNSEPFEIPHLPRSLGATQQTQHGKHGMATSHQGIGMLELCPNQFIGVPV